MAVLSFLFWLVLREQADSTLDLSFMPAVNASFNAASALLLLSGFRAIKRGNRELHKRLMVLALVSSSLFLLGYIAYHYVHGDTKYVGEGVLRTVYFALLISHVVLSMVVVPMVFTTVYFAATERFESHKKLARFTFPIWLYVSVTGVLVFWMLHG